ncbi:aprataxin-like protein [Exophiala oligosperma]
MEEEIASEAKASIGKRDAFSELMSPRVKRSKPEQPSSKATGGKHSGRNPYDPRNGLLVYILDPIKYAPNVVITYNERVVLIRDAFPKATVHLLLLPRDPDKRDMHPRDALNDLEFLGMVKTEAAEALELAASELSRQLGPYSESCKERIAAMESDEIPDELPPGRDFAKEFKIGIHAHPSMHHLHVHIISRDMHSDRLKHQKHYNSFNTDFFIPLEDFPLAENDNGNLKKEYKCWRCGKLFGNKFQQLKAHLEEEFLAWRKI